MKKFAVLLLLVAMAAAACDGEVAPPTTDGGTDTTQAPDTTEAPEPTTGPEPTDPPDTTEAPDDDATDTPWWILLVVGAAVLVLIAAVARRGSRSATATVPPVTWKTHAQNGYAAARWLYDALGEDMAVWRGNATFDGTTDVGSTAATSKAETWNEIQLRQGQALDALYALEASPPDNQTAILARNTITTLRAAREAVDNRAEARFAYRTAEKDGREARDMMDARDREVRASRNLAEARARYATALTDLSTLV